MIGNELGDREEWSILLKLTTLLTGHLANPLSEAILFQTAAPLFGIGKSRHFWLWRTGHYLISYYVSEQVLAKIREKGEQ